MAKFNSFEEIISWQKARELNKEAFEILKLKVNEVSKLVSGLIKYLNSTL